MMIVHGRATSANVQLVMWAIGELGLEHERRDVGGAFGGTTTPEFLAMNPNALVPVLQDGNVTMFESAAILRYLGARYGDEGFWPPDPGRRGRLDQWAEWAKITLGTQMITLFVQMIRTREADRKPDAIAAALAEMKRLARIADARIGAGPWLDGEAFTFADIGFGHQLYRYYTLPIERVPTPNLDAYYERLTRRPAYARHVMVSYDSMRVS